MNLVDNKSSIQYFDIRAKITDQQFGTTPASGFQHHSVWKGQKPEVVPSI